MTVELLRSGANAAPTVDTEIPDQTATAGIAFNYAFPDDTFNDANDDTLTYTATLDDNNALPGWLTFTAATRTFSGTPTTAGTIAVKVTVSDGNGGSISDTFNIVVEAGPTVTIVADRATATGKLDFVRYTLTREGDPAAALTVPVTFAGPAGNDWGLDLNGSARRDVTFAAGDLTAESDPILVGGGSSGIGFSTSTTTGGMLTAQLGAVAGYDTSDTHELEVVVTDGPAWSVEQTEDSYTFTEGSGVHDIEVVATAATADVPAPTVSYSNQSVLAIALINRTRAVRASRTALPRGASRTATRCRGRGWCGSGARWAARWSMHSASGWRGARRHASQWPAYRSPAVRRRCPRMRPTMRTACPNGRRAPVAKRRPEPSPPTTCGFEASSTSPAGAAKREDTPSRRGGRVSTGGFDTEVDEVTMDGEVTTGLLGFDAEWDDVLAGVMLSQSTGEGAYRLAPAQGGDGTVKSDLTGVYPYARIGLDARVSAWALAGVGSGSLTLTRDGHKAMKADLSMRMGALGVMGQVLDGTGPSGVRLDLKSDAMWVGTKSARVADMMDSEGDVTRLRLVAQGERGFVLAGQGTLTPSAELGLRHDGGDAETGVGVELGAGLRYMVGSFTIEGQARTLVAHQASGYEEWGASAAVRLEPGATGRGLSLSIAPAWGRTGSASERLWSARDAGGLGGTSEFEADGRIEAQVGYGFALPRERGRLPEGKKEVPGNYGFALPRERGLLTPYGALILGSEGARTMRGGARWLFDSDLVVTLDATRRESAGAGAESEVRVQAALRF